MLVVVACERMKQRQEAVDPNLNRFRFDEIGLSSFPTSLWAFDIVQTAQL